VEMKSRKVKAKNRAVKVMMNLNLINLNMLLIGSN
jgi:hypothetical protein